MLPYFLHLTTRHKQLITVSSTPQGQIGNPDGPEKPNKKFYDPRVWLRKSEESAVVRLGEAFADLKTVGQLG